jgi:ribonuclease P protein component
MNQNLPQTFSKSLRLCSKKVMDEVFAKREGFSAYPFKIFYLLHDTPVDSTVQVVFSAPKRYHKNATSRNLCKRRMREVWRRNWQLLHKPVQQTGKNLAVVIVLNSRDIPPYKLTEDKILLLLSRLQKAIES